MNPPQLEGLETSLDSFAPDPDLPALLQLRLIAGEFDHRVGGGGNPAGASADVTHYLSALARAEAISLAGMDVQSVRELHALLFGGKGPSELRHTPVAVRFNRPGSRIWSAGARPDEIVPRLEEMQTGILRNASLGRFERIALLHLELLRTHPFEDGNGRLCRLLLTALVRSEFASHVYLGITRIMKGNFVRYNALIRSQREEAYSRWIHYCAGAITAELHAARRFNAALQTLSTGERAGAAHIARELLTRLREGSSTPQDAVPAGPAATENLSRLFASLLEASPIGLRERGAARER